MSRQVLSRLGFQDANLETVASRHQSPTVMAEEPPPSPQNPDAGKSAARLKLGHQRYRSGEKVKAAKLFEQAALPESHFLLGRMLMYGDGIEQDEKKATHAGNERL